MNEIKDDFEQIHMFTGEFSTMDEGLSELLEVWKSLKEPQLKFVTILPIKFINGTVKPGYVARMSLEWKADE